MQNEKKQKEKKQNPQDDIQGQKPPPHNPFLAYVPLALEAPQRPQLNWPHFKPEFAGKPEKDAEAHLLRTDNWIGTHNFLDNVKVQRFCLTLIGEARLW